MKLTKAKIALKALWSLGISLVMSIILPTCLLAADDNFRLEFDLFSRNAADSNRKDFYIEEYAIDKVDPEIKKQQYDESYFTTENDMFLALRGDLNETQFLDIKETLFYQHFNQEDGLSRAYDSYRLRKLDHQLNLTYGIAAGDHDYFQLDYFNNIYDVPEYKSWNMSSNKGQALFSHEISNRTCFVLSGDYEERLYDNDSDSDYKQGHARIEISTLLPGRHAYKPLANSARGNRRYFEKFPNGLSARKAVDYYTGWVKNPRDDDPRAKYMTKKTRGDLYLRLLADFYNQDRVNIDNGFNHAELGFEATYEIGHDVGLEIKNAFSKREYDKESNVYFMHDFVSNYLSVSSNYDYTESLSQRLTFINEYFHFGNTPDQDYRNNSIFFEGFYEFGNSLAAIYLGGSQKSYDESRADYPDEKEVKAVFSYDYSITDGLLFRLKEEWVDKDMENNENSLYSSYVRNTWRIAIEKILSENHSLELGFLNNSEKHDNFKENDIEEKSLNFSWLVRF